ncbi:hypothetical protein BOTBODRAFT_180180 [Botryobasidium botryosum FD-172 SS1]|uniref:Uncharacterized protein n=1 Tax=Botryobasidium botryosum (strain FD-172 SS1) TaxID=930990 RepID=A0A067LXB5_BOTB1|nr:hypothetical protein BOTBODRAFT_180180 [Botryobasidium botryosum FD-172 SS1]
MKDIIEDIVSPEYEGTWDDALNTVITQLNITSNLFSNYDLASEIDSQEVVSLLASIFLDVVFIFYSALQAIECQEYLSAATPIIVTTCGYLVNGWTAVPSPLYQTLATSQYATYFESMGLNLASLLAASN